MDKVQDSLETALAVIEEELNRLRTRNLEVECRFEATVQLLKIEKIARELRSEVIGEELDVGSIRAAAELATPGPWWADSHGHTVVQHATFQTVFSINPSAMEKSKRCEVTGNLSNWRNDSDLDFILKTDPSEVLRLLDRLEEAESGYKPSPKLTYHNLEELVAMEGANFHPNVLQVLEKAVENEQRLTELKYHLNEVYSPTMRKLISE